MNVHWKNKLHPSRKYERMEIIAEAIYVQKIQKKSAIIWNLRDEKKETTGYKSLKSTVYIFYKEIQNNYGQEFYFINIEKWQKSI